MAFAFTGGDEDTQKRVAAVAKPAGQARGRGPAPVQDAAQKRKNVAAMLKDVEKNRAAKKEKPTMRRRLEQAGFSKTSPKQLLDDLRHRRPRWPRRSPSSPTRSRW